MMRYVACDHSKSERRNSLPLSKRARIEIYIPERETSNYAVLESVFEQEFLHTFGGCTVIRNIKGMYLGSDDKTDVEPVSLVYSDTPFDFEENFDAIEQYTEELRAAALEASEEESILIVVHEIYHSL
jgi:hypothetical protein